MNKSDGLEPQADLNAPGIPPSTRLLLRMVYIMGVVLVLLFIALVGGIIWKSTRKEEPKVPVAPPVISLGLPADAEIRSTQIDGDRLVINTGRDVIVIDLRKNSIANRITTTP